MPKTSSNRSVKQQNREQMASQFVQSGIIKGVIEETKKVVWPSGEELARLTGVVVVTVLLFTIIIGGVDALLSTVVKPLYTAGPTASATAAPTATAEPTANVTPAATATPKT